MKKTLVSALNAAAMRPARASFLSVMVQLLCGAGSERGGVGFAGADADGLVETQHEDLAVADLSGFGGGRDGLDDLVGLGGCNRHLDLEFRQEAHRVFGAAVRFRVALWTSGTPGLGDGHSVHANLSQSVADLVELERLDDGHDDFHGTYPPWRPALTTTDWAVATTPRRRLPAGVAVAS